MGQKLEELQQRIGYKFRDLKLLKNALMHSSYTNEKHLPKYQCNERFEFLGDAVLELVSSDYLFHENQEVSEGILTRKRASMVCEPALAYCAREIELGKYLLLGKGENATGGRERDSVTSDAMEALIGAIYLDGKDKADGFTNAKEFIEEYIMKDQENKRLFYDSKTILQEIVQADNGGAIEYRMIKEEGPDHNKAFYIDVYIGDDCFGKGKGRTKKASEQDAAYQAILKLRERGVSCI